MAFKWGYYSLRHGLMTSCVAAADVMGCNDSGVCWLSDRRCKGSFQVQGRGPGNSRRRGMGEFPGVRRGQEQQPPPARVQLVTESFSTWEFGAPSPLAFEKLLCAKRVLHLAVLSLPPLQAEACESPGFLR